MSEALEDQQRRLQAHEDRLAENYRHGLATTRGADSVPPLEYRPPSRPNTDAMEISFYDFAAGEEVASTRTLHPSVFAPGLIVVTPHVQYEITRLRFFANTRVLECGVEPVEL